MGMRMRIEGGLGKEGDIVLKGGIRVLSWFLFRTMPPVPDMIPA